MALLWVANYDSVCINAEYTNLQGVVVCKHSYQISIEKGNGYKEQKPTNIKIYGKKMKEEVNTFKYLESIIWSNGSSNTEFKTRFQMASSVRTRLNLI